jgi:hypothetical protein
MFEDTEEMLSLYQAMDRMKNAMVLMLARCAGATLKVKKQIMYINCHSYTAFAMALFL